MEKLKSTDLKMIKMFLDCLNEPVSIIEDGIFADCNKETLEMMKLSSPSDFNGKTPWEISPEKQPDGRFSDIKARDMINKCLEDGSNRFEWHHLRPDGTSFFADVLLVKIPETEKKVVLVIWRDITEAVQERETLVKTEKIYKAVLDNAPTAIMIHKNNRWVYANKAVSGMFGVDMEKIIGLDIFKYVAPDQKKMIMENAAKRSRGEKVPDRYDMHIITEDGEEKYLDVKISPVLFNGENSTLINCVDITERVYAKKELEESEEHLKTTLNSIGDAVIATDKNGYVTMMNPLAQKLTGWSLDDAKGKSLNKIFKIVNAHTRKKVASPVEKVLKVGEVVGLANHTVLCSRSGREYQIADSGAPIKNSKGEINGVVLVFRDVTEQYLLEEQLKQTQKMDAMGQLASGVAHDFNNLIGGLMGNAELLSDLVTKDSELLEYVDNIRNISLKTMDLTKRLLDFSRKSSREYKSISVCDLIDDTIKLVQTGIGRNIEIKRNFSSKEIFIKGDVSQLQNGLINLIFNARDAMSDKGVITIETSIFKINDDTVNTLFLTPGDYAAISVIDTGCGMEPEVMERIFEPFFTTREKSAGTGLGLVSVNKAVKDHSGTVTVTSTPGKGSVFTLYLPIDPNGSR
jgi:PAS domain S-box-containing protein